MGGTVTCPHREPPPMLTLITYWSAMNSNRTFWWFSSTPAFRGPMCLHITRKGFPENCQQLIFNDVSYNLPIFAIFF